MVCLFIKVSPHFELMFRDPCSSSTIGKALKKPPRTRQQQQSWASSIALEQVAQRGCQICKSDFHNPARPSQSWPVLAVVTVLLWAGVLTKRPSAVPSHWCFSDLMILWKQLQDGVLMAGCAQAAYTSTRKEVMPLCLYNLRAAWDFPCLPVVV